MTIREFYVNVLDLIDVIESDDPTGCVDTKIMGDKARELIAALDARNEKRKSAESKEKRESASRRETVLGLLSETPVFAESIADASGLTVGQVRSALSTLVREGKASKSEVKDGKSRKMAYTLSVEA